MSKPICYRKVKAYKTPTISKPSAQEGYLAKCLVMLNDGLDNSSYRYVVDQHGQVRLMLRDDLVNNSSYWEAASRLKLDEQKARTSASPDLDKTDDEDPFFKVLRKVNTYSTYGMYTVYEPKQLTIDDALKEDK